MSPRVEQRTTRITWPEKSSPPPSPPPRNSTSLENPQLEPATVPTLSRGILVRSRSPISRFPPCPPALGVSLLPSSLLPPSHLSPPFPVSKLKRSSFGPLYVRAIVVLRCGGGIFLGAILFGLQLRRYAPFICSSKFRITSWFVCCPRHLSRPRFVVVSRISSSAQLSLSFTLVLLIGASRIF